MMNGEIGERISGAGKVDGLNPSTSQSASNHANGDSEMSRIGLGASANEPDLNDDGSVLPEGAEDDDESDARQGTVSSARFNILSTMVGGGSLSLPLAFHKSGNGLVGPLLIILVAASAEFCFHVLVASAALVTKPPENVTRKGADSFQSVASAAFGPNALVASMALVTAMCFFGTVGYAVLLRDMLVPIADAIAPPPQEAIGVSLAHNIGMLTVILIVTPLCTLQTLTALRRFGATSMMSVLVLGTCVLYRSLQCNYSSKHASNRHSSWFEYITYFPHSTKDMLDVFPLFISCFVCHYNILPVHNELRRPTKQRVSWWIRSTTWFAASFYLMIGFAGSMYGNCTLSGHVQGNILLDFDEDDQLLFMGRMCLALTITLAFPMLVIPARDIVIRAVEETLLWSATSEDEADGTIYNDAHSQLREPLLEAEVNGDAAFSPIEDEEHASAPFTWRLAAAVFVFWSGAALACCVTSIDVVWDLLGSSLSILLSYLIPCGSYIVLTRKRASSSDADETATQGWRSRFMIYTSWFLILLSTPLMFTSTGNAVYNMFIR